MSRTGFIGQNIITNLTVITQPNPSRNIRASREEKGRKSFVNTLNSLCTGQSFFTVVRHLFYNDTRANMIISDFYAHSKWTLRENINKITSYIGCEETSRVFCVCAWVRLLGWRQVPVASTTGLEGGGRAGQGGGVRGVRLQRDARPPFGAPETGWVSSSLPLTPERSGAPVSEQLL